MGEAENSEEQKEKKAYNKASVIPLYPDDCCLTLSQGGTSAFAPPLA